MNTDSTLTQSITFLAFMTAALLLIPIIAMQFTDEVVWTLSDFIVAGVLLFGTGLSYLLITNKASGFFYRAAVGIALFSGLFLIWSNLAVGIIGSEDNFINVWYFGVILIGLTGAGITRLRAKGMIYTMSAMAAAQAIIAVTAIIGGYYQVPPGSVLQIVGVNGFFITLFVISALLFQRAAEDDDSIIPSE